MKKKLLLIVSFILLSHTFIFTSPNEDLYKSTKKGDLTGIKKVIKRHANLNVRDRAGRSSLHIAAERGYLKIVNFFI
jgi:ankyrin repeat protein